jgi:hypothetical protein
MAYVALLVAPAVDLIVVGLVNAVTQKLIGISRHQLRDKCRWPDRGHLRWAG